MRNIILFLLRFPVERDTTQVFTQNVDIKTLTFPLAARMYPMETKRAKACLALRRRVLARLCFQLLWNDIACFFRIATTSNMEF